MPVLDADAIYSHLGGSSRFKTWLDQLDQVKDAGELTLPDDETAEALLTRYGVGIENRMACLAGRPDPTQDPHVWWILKRAHHEVISRMGQYVDGDWYMGWPSLPDDIGPAGDQVYVWAFLASVSAAERFHLSRGIPKSVSHATLSHLSVETSFWSQSRQRQGIQATWMLPIMLQGASYRLGRHMFDRYGRQLSTHIPPGETLTPHASEASFALAREFFPRYFPEDQIEEFTCHSWLMDDQWQKYLPESSNIVQFQRRFTLSRDEPEAGEYDILTFVFNRDIDGPVPSGKLLATLPQTTTLQRSFVTHLRNGGRWWTRTGTRHF